MEFKVNCIQKKDKTYDSGFEGEVLQMFGISPDEHLSKVIYCNVAHLVTSIKNGDKYFVEIDGKKTYLKVNISQDGLEYVETIGNNTILDNLLSLPTCEIDFKVRIDDKITDSTPEKGLWVNFKANPLLALFPFLLGLLFTLFCTWLSGGCKKQSSTDASPIVIHDTILVPNHCPMYDKLIRKTKVHFLFDKSDTLNISPKSGLDSLKKFGELLKKDSLLYVDIRGYTDHKGGEKYNDSLSSKREKSIRNYFIGHGVKSNQIQIQEALGKRFATNSKDSTIRAKDRKVEILIYGVTLK